MTTATPSGFQGPSDLGSDFKAVSFLVQQLIGRTSTNTVVKVVAVTNAGGVSPTGYVDVQPMVDQIDGAGNATPHGVVHNLPYIRIQGGGNAVILDPQVGDLGLASFASHDISSVKATGARSTPGSRRRFSYEDGIYTGGILNGTPANYLRFAPDMIEIVATTKVHIQAPSVLITSTVTVTGDLIANGISLDNHVHTGVTSGSGDTGGPIG